MINQQEYVNRRNKLAARLPAGAIAIIPAAPEVLRNGDVHYRYRQDSNFYYLTGFCEPEAVLVLFACNGKACCYLFNRPRDPVMEIWQGKRIGQEGALELLAVDNSYPVNEFKIMLPALLKDKTIVFYPLGSYRSYQKILLQAFSHAKKFKNNCLTAIADLAPVMSELRLIKSSAEVALLKRAAEISINAHLELMKACTNLENEQQLEAIFFASLYQQGAKEVAYEPIIAGGVNACILHYNFNDALLNKKDLLLVDAGAEFAGYAADITRTYPLSGIFNKEQAALYDLVLQAQIAAIAVIKPGLQWHKMQELIVEILTEGLLSLGILKGKKTELIANEKYKSFYMHGSGHWLGLDVHDAGDYMINNEWRPLSAGMVLTVEPGLYIAEDASDVSAKWRGIGLRIEDDILVTANGYENLTAALPKEIAVIEELMQVRK